MKRYFKDRIEEQPIKSNFPLEKNPPFKIKTAFKAQQDPFIIRKQKVPT